MAVYPNLEAEMARSGITQKDIANLLKKTPETISNWMNGKSGEFPVSAVMTVKRELFPNHDVEYLFAEVPLAS